MTCSTFFNIAIALLVASLSLCAEDARGFAVFRSFDRGVSWTRSDAGIPGGPRVNGFGSTDGVLFAGTDSGIFSSRDRAAHWKAGSGVATSSGRILSFAAVAGTAFAGTDGNGLLQSSNAGLAWTPDPTFPSQKVRCLLAYNGRVYAGTDSDGVFAFSGSGQHWTALSIGLPSSAQIFALSAVGDRLFAGLYGRGLYRLDDRNESWIKVAKVTPLALASVQDTLIAGHNPGGLHWSGDLGISWSRGVADVSDVGPSVPLLAKDFDELVPEAPVWELGSGHGLVLAGASAGIYSSEDRGRTWRRASRGLPRNSPGVAFLVSADLVLASVMVRGGEAEGVDLRNPPVEAAAVESRPGASATR